MSPYLLQPLRALEIARIENIVRKSWAVAWTRGAGTRDIAEEALRAVQTAFPEMSPSAVAAAVERLRKSA